jgi:nucleoside-diphosphate kinase
MFDIKQKRTFLKRTQIDNLSEKDFYIGASVNVFSRQLFIRDFGDHFTSSKLDKALEKAMIFIDSLTQHNAGKIINELIENKFNVNRMRLVPGERGNCIVIEIMKVNVVQELDQIISSNNSLVATHFQQGSLSTTNDPKDLNNAFSKNTPRTANFKNSTLCIIKPHAINAGLAGKIIDAIIQKGFSITDMEMLTMEKPNALEFLEVYKDVLLEYHLILEQLISGRVIAMEITGDTKNVVQEFREFCGPSDPELAKLLRPASLRGLFGGDKVKNAVHCTDLTDDAPLEVEYFFKILN